MKKRTILFATIAGVILAGGAVALTLVLTPGSTSSAPKSSVSTETATVSQGQLAERIRVNGTLAYEGKETLGTTLGGTLTALTPVGTVVGQGGELFRVDDQPVLLMYGTLPTWRSFEQGMDDGRDVLQLEQNLAALGFFDREPDEEFAWSTAAAIKAWQESLGLEKTGMIEPGRIVFAPTALRVTEHKAATGVSAGADILAVSSNNKTVTALVSPPVQAVVAVGTQVSVSLPGGTSTLGTVRSLGAPIEKEDNAGSKALKIPVTITLDDPASADAYSDVGVSMEVSRVLNEDALLVPVLALLAQPGGGFAVEIVKGDTTKLVPVELGSFADGQVEVTKGKIAAGDKVAIGK